MGDPDRFAEIVADLTALREWLERGFQYAAAMPPKDKMKPAGKKKK